MVRLAPVALLVLLGGCCTPPKGTPPNTAFEAVERVNDNLSKIEGVLYCPSLVSFEFRDPEGKKHSVPLRDALLIFRPPQCLLFQVKSLVGTMAEFGSNDERYWLWVEDHMWWGWWEKLREGVARRLPVPPNELLDALTLRPLPERLDAGPTPLLRIEGDDHRLLFVRLRGDGEPIGWREIKLQPHPPYQPIEITDRLPDGAVLMHATLENYKQIGPDGPYTARRYVVRWPADEAVLRLDIARAEFRPDLEELDDEDLCGFPETFEGEVEQIDAPKPVGLSRAGLGGMKLP